MGENMNEIIKILEEIRPTANFKGSNNFIEDDLLDSFDIVSLVAALENNFNIKIDATNILIDNFISIEAIQNLVKISGGNI